MRDYKVTVKVASGIHAVVIRAVSEKAIRRLWGDKVVEVTLQ